MPELETPRWRAIRLAWSHEMRMVGQQGPGIEAVAVLPVRNDLAPLDRQPDASVPGADGIHQRLPCDAAPPPSS